MFFFAILVLTQRNHARTRCASLNTALVFLGFCSLTTVIIFNLSLINIFLKLFLMTIRILFVLFFMLNNFIFYAQKTPIAYTGALIHTINGTPLENGTLIIQNGKILAVGDDLKIPKNAKIYDVKGKIIMPGLIDTHSHLGNGSGGDQSNSLHPDVRLLDALNPMAVNLMKARAGGLTTINIMPGSGHLMSGQTAYIKTKKGKTIEELAICQNISTEI